jgi:hypothetical protein
VLQRRTFLGLLAGIAGTILSVARSVSPASWWRRPTRVQTASPSQNEPGIKITTINHTTSWHPSGSVSDLSMEPQVLYVQGEWRRLELPRTWGGNSKAERNYGPQIVMITRPDIGQQFELNLDASQYTQMPYPLTQKRQPLTKEQMEARGIKIPSPGEVIKPTFRIETVTRDTGERKQMFGYTARHVITTRKEIPLEGSGRAAQEMTRDGWYIDLEPEFYSYPRSPKPPNRTNQTQSGRVHAYASLSSHRPGEEPKVPERPEFVDIGEPETGFAVQERRTSRSNIKLADRSMRETQEESETSVTIERRVFDASLFEVPLGFKRVPYINRNPA